MQTLDKYLELYQSNREQIGRDDPPFLTEQRELAIAAFRRSGFPERKEATSPHPSSTSRPPASPAATGKPA